MKGRTNISGGGMNINADVENFTVASGSNVTAGNFVQYKMEESDKKYDSNSGYENGTKQKVIACGNSRYVSRYVNNSYINTYRFNLIDVSNGFKVLSAISIQNSYAPDFCILQDGKLAVCYTEKERTYTIRIYDISENFLLLNTYELTDENINVLSTGLHITTVGNSKIVISKYNSAMLCNYENGVIGEYLYVDLGINHESEYSYQVYRGSENDWSLFSTEENGIVVFATFRHFSGELPTSYPETLHYMCYFKIEGNSVNLINKKSIHGGKYLNQFIWGNISGLNGKILFSTGSKDENIKENVSYETKVYYVENDIVVESQSIDLFEYIKDIFLDNSTTILNSANGEYSSGTAQYVKDNVFYVAVLKQTSVYSNSKFKVAIVRIEYEKNTDKFSVSNSVYFENENAISSKSFICYYGYGQFFESEDGDVYYLYETGNRDTLEKTGRWMMKLTYRNGVLEIGENTGMVENFTGIGAAIGVAKQSGKPGDVIEIYTPKV